MIRLRLFHGLSQTYLGVVNSELPSYDCDASIVYEKSFNEGDLLDFRISTPAGIKTGSIGSPDDCISCVSRNHAYEVSKEISEEFEELTVGVFFPALVEPRPVADYIYALEDELEDSTLDIISVSTIIDLLTFSLDNCPNDKLPDLFLDLWNLQREKESLPKVFFCYLPTIVIIFFINLINSPTYK